MLSGGSSSFLSTARHPLTAAAVAQPTIPTLWVSEAGGGTMRAAQPRGWELLEVQMQTVASTREVWLMASKATTWVGEYIAMLDNVATKHT